MEPSIVSYDGKDKAMHENLSYFITRYACSLSPKYMQQCYDNVGGY